MSNVNKVILVGRTGSAPEVKQFDWGKVAEVSLATTEKYKKKDGEKVEETEWHTLKFIGPVVDVVEKYVDKGDLLYIEGSIKTRSWDKDGTKHYKTEIKVRDIKMLGSGNLSVQPNEEVKKGKKTEEIQNDDLPF